MSITTQQLQEYESRDLTLQEIGILHGISRERVRQLFMSRLKRAKVKSDKVASYKRLKVQSADSALGDG